MPPYLQTFFEAIDKFGLSLLALIFTLPLLAPTAEIGLTNFTHAKEFSIGVAGFIGTVLVLAFSLSIIPVQRASEAMPVSVVRLFARDPTNIFLFVALAFLCLVSFFLAISDGPWPRRPILIPLQFLLIGITFDLVRWYHRHILSLLEPTRGVVKLLNEALRFIRNTDRRVHLLVAVQWLLVPRHDRRNTSREELATVIYRGLPHHATVITQWIHEIEEAALRSTEQVETRSAHAAVDSLTAIGLEYLLRRRHTLTPILVNLLGVYESDLRDVLTPLYESLNRVAFRAIASKNESVVVRVVQGLGRLALTCATLQSRAFRQERAPLAPVPIAYMERSALAALAEGQHDAGLEASRALAAISLGAPKNIDLSDVHIVVADTVLRIVATLLGVRQPALANFCLDDYLRGVRGVITSHHHEADHYLRHVLRELSGIIPVAVAVEGLTGRNLMTTPLGPAYDTANQLALAYSLASVAQPDDEGGRNPYHYFSELSDEFHRHLRDVAENIDFKDSSLTWHIVRSIQYVSELYATLVSTAEQRYAGAVRDLAKKQLPWYLAFHWVHFAKAQQINLQTAEKATESLGQIALTFTQLDIGDIAHSAIENIGSVTKAYAKLGRLSSQYDIADLLRPLLCVERFAVQTGNRALIEQIERKIHEIMEVFEEDVWAAVDEAVDVRRAQIDDDLADWFNNRLIDRDTTAGLLARMLQERGLL